MFAEWRQWKRTKNNKSPGYPGWHNNWLNRTWYGSGQYAVGLLSLYCGRHWYGGHLWYVSGRTWSVNGQLTLEWDITESTEMYWLAGSSTRGYGSGYKWVGEGDSPSPRLSDLVLVSPRWSHVTGNVVWCKGSCVCRIGLPNLVPSTALWRWHRRNMLTWLNRQFSSGSTRCFWSPCLSEDSRWGVWCGVLHVKVQA